MTAAQDRTSESLDGAFLIGCGEMADRILAHDWSTSLGPIATWPGSLRTTVGLLVHSAVPLVLLWGPDGIMIYNDAYSVFAGRRHPHLLGSKVREGWPEVADFNDNVMNVVMSGRTLAYKDLELKLRRSGKLEPVWMNLDYSPVYDESGRPGGVIAIVVETTERVLADRRNAAERDRLAQMFEQAPTFMALLSGPEHRVELANPGYMQLVGHRPVLGRTIAEALPDAVEQGYLRLLDQVFESGVAFSADSAKFDMQPVPGGEVVERYVDFVFQPIKDATGTVIGIFVEGADVTRRKRAEIALHELNASLEQQAEAGAKKLATQKTMIQTFFANSHECYGVLVEDGDRFRYEEVNPATLDLYDLSREQVIGRYVEDVVDPVWAVELNRHLANCLRFDTVYRYERRQGRRIIEAVATPMPKGHDDARRVLVSARDATERRSLEEQLRQAQKMEAVGQLTGGLAHDFNNLLMGISGSLEIVEQRLAQGRFADVDRFIGAAQGAARRAATLTQRLLAFARRQTLDPKPIRADGLIAEMEDLVRRTVGPDVEVEVIGAADLWTTRVDPSQLESALLNLCINARDAMAPGGGRLTIETANHSLDERAAKANELPPGQYVSLSVTDTGTGMAPDVVARVFDPFFTTKPLGQGTGLGLSMVYGFVRQSGGQVRIATEVGRGTTMRLYLPRYTGGDEPAEDEAIESATDAGDGETVLVIDDDATVRLLVVEVLEENGYTVLEAADGLSGLRVLQSAARIDLLITDVGLPGGLNGRQVADAARATRAGLKILFITGYAQNAAMDKIHQESGMDVVTKPFAMASFANKVREMIDRRG